MSDLKSNNILADKGWALMEEQLDIVMPAKKPKRRYLFFLFPFIGVLAIASLWLFIDKNNNPNDLKENTNTIENTIQLAEIIESENKLYKPHLLPSEANQNGNIESKGIVSSNKIEQQHYQNAKSKNVKQKTENSITLKHEKENIESIAISKPQEKVLISKEVYLTTEQDNLVEEYGHELLPMVLPLMSKDISLSFDENRKESNKPLQIRPYKPNRNSIGIKSGIHMGSKIPISGAELGLSWGYKIGRRGSISTGASYKYINYKEETARAIQLGSGVEKAYEVNGGWLSTDDEAFELPDQFVIIPLTVSYKITNRISVYAGPSFSVGIPISLGEKIGLADASAPVLDGGNGLSIEELFEEKNSRIQDFGDFTFIKNQLLINAGIQYQFNRYWSIDLGFTTALEKGRSYTGLKLSDPDFSTDFVTQAEVSPYLDKLLPTWYGSISISRSILSF
jgi:hypothetical protein